MTPLYDAIGRGVDGLDKRAGDGKAVLVIVTDGLENYSRKHTELIHARQDRGWLFVFLGADFAAAQQGTAMGIQAGNVANIGMDEHSPAQHDGERALHDGRLCRYAGLGRSKGLCRGSSVFD